MKARAFCAMAAAFWIVMLAAPSLHADASSWAFVGGGPAWLSKGKDKYDFATTLQFDLGVGTAPSHPWIVGGLFRMSPYFKHGTDLSLMGRLATQGFVVGSWGAALDCGGYQRWWGEGSTGIATSLQVAAPFGLTLGVNGSMGTHDARSVSVILGVDFARLTVYRLGGESLWANPRPAWRPTDEAPLR